MAEELKFNVKTNIDDAAKDAEKLGDNIEKAKKETEGLEDATKKGTGGFKKMGMAVKGFGMALKAAGIGLIIALFVTLKEALNRNQKVMNAVNTIMTTVSTTFNQVVGVLTDVVKWVTESKDRFDGLTKVISGLMTIALTPLKLSFYAIKLGVQSAMLAWEDSFLGGGDADKIAELREDIADTKQDILDVGLAAIKAGKDIGANIGDAISEVGAIYEKAAKGISDISIKANYEQAKATTEAKNAALLAAAINQGIIEQKDKEAELQRQIRDDESKTFAQRIEANNELLTILEEQEKLMLANAKIVENAAALALAANTTNVELQVAYQEALNETAAIEAQVAGFKSEQMTNQVGLEKELGEVKSEILLAGLAGIELELSELARAYELKLEMARKAGEDTVAITEQYAKDQADIVKSYLDIELAWADMTGEQKLQFTKERAGKMAQLLGEETEAGRAFAIIQTTIDTYQSAQAAFSSMAKIPYVGPILGGIAAAAAIAMGLKNIQMIRSASTSGGGGGSMPSAAPTTPRTEIASGAFTLEGGTEPEPARAYVVSDDITDSQNKLANIRRRATI
jgi:hypothetical protein